MEQNNFDAMQGQLVYVKPVMVGDLPSEVQEQAGDLQTLYAVHNEEGEQLALVAHRALAFDLARQFEMVPMTVH